MMNKELQQQPRDIEQIMFLGLDSKIKGGGRNLHGRIHFTYLMKLKFLQLCFKTMKSNDEDEPNNIIYLLWMLISHI